MKNKQIKFEDLDDFQKDMLKDISEYRERTGKDMPTYDEMLGFEESKFQSWILFRTSEDIRKDLLDEMIDHEERTKSFHRTATGNESPIEQLVLDAFKKEDSEEIINTINNLDKVAKETGYEEEHGKEADLVNQIIYAKATSDFVNLKDNQKLNKKDSNISNKHLIVFATFLFLIYAIFVGADLLEWIIFIGIIAYLFFKK